MTQFLCLVSKNDCKQFFPLTDEVSQYFRPPFLLRPQLLWYILSKYKNQTFNTTVYETVDISGTKKHQKREHRKSPSHLAVALGPALFSTPDIIRRVGSGSEPKTPEAVAASPTKTAPPLTSASSPIAATAPTTTSASIPEDKIDFDSIQPHLRLELGMENHSEPGGLGDVAEEDDQNENKAPLAEDLHASLDAGKFDLQILV